jgi:SAM-dependent methyltransferase
LQHIENDYAFLSEIFRILKPGGKLILTTPNKVQSLTRNPWHVREYLVSELEILYTKCGFKLESLGVFGNNKVAQYLVKNKESISKITRWDIFNLQYNLPRTWLQVPYDILNRMNRKKVAAAHLDITKNITTEDFSLAKANNDCLDLFYIGTK